MFDFFKKKEGITTPDVKGLRHTLVHFIKEQLQKVEGGEGGRIQAIRLYLYPAATERHLYESAVYLEEDGKFRREQVQKIADDYSIALPQDWKFEIVFTPAPQHAIKSPDITAAVVFETHNKRAALPRTPALLTVMHGTAEQE